VIAALVVGMPVVASLLLAASARLPDLASTLLAAYLAFVAATVGIVLLLSPSRLVTRNGLAVAELVLLALALGVWWLRGRPRPPLGAAWAALGAALRRPETALFAAAVLVLLGYELLLGLAVPPANWDSLTYHLARAAAWAQHGGYFWVPNAPTDRINEFQPLAEQEQLYGFAATGGGALYAMPQFLAQLAILVAVYGVARRLGFGRRQAVSASLLLATLSLVALEATTAQNDLVAASFPVVAACLLLGETPLEAALGGVSVSFGIGAKLTTALVLPVVFVLAAMRRPRLLVPAVAGGVLAFAAVGMWGYYLNDAHTGQLLGHGGGRVENTTSPSWPGSAITALYLLYETMDLSALSDHLIRALAVVGVVAGAIAAVVAVWRRRASDGPVEAAGVAAPFASALLAVWAGGAIAWLARRWGYPIRGPGGVVGPLTRKVNEDYSAFGPLGALLVVMLPLLGVLAYVRRWARAEALALAATVPLFVTLLVLQARWNEFLTRFLLVPVVLAAPLFAVLYLSRLVGAAFSVVAVLVAAVTILHIQSKPFDQRPWTFSQLRALEVAQDPEAGAALTAYHRLVPPHACVGAVLDTDEPAYLLFGSRLRHRVEFLPVTTAVHDAVIRGLFYVVITTGTNRYAADSFRASGWRIRPLGRYWLLASEPKATTGEC
jgi:hypothetical protein